MRLSGKCALITGAGRGIGRAIARGYAAEGADIAIVEVDQETGADAAREIEKLGGRALFVPTDVSSPNLIPAMVARVIQEFGKIDILVNSAAVHISEPFLSVTEEIYDRTLDTNLKGAFFCAQAVAKHMVAARRGKIIHMSSISAEVADVGSGHYCMAKGGIKMLTRAMALELAPYNVHVNAIAPGTIKTDLGGWYETEEAEIYRQQRVPWQKFGTPEDIVGAAVFLACNESDYVTGTSVVIDGGLLTS